jgi:formylglycine-generating enzyme
MSPKGVRATGLLCALGLRASRAWAERGGVAPTEPPSPAQAKNLEELRKLGLKPPAEKPAEEPRAGTGTMVKLEGGTFSMGSSRGGGDEKPVHPVKVDPFWMDETEVTADAYKACVSAGACSKADDGARCTSEKADRGKHPIDYVDVEQGKTYCEWAHKRLPTEEEWEYAARAAGSKGAIRTFPWGDEPPSGQLCWKGKGAPTHDGTCEVGSVPAGNTPAGLKDMAGSVAEWTSSRYCRYSGAGYDVTDCSSSQVRRGGDWMSNEAQWVRGAVRMMEVPKNRSGNVGFRCARSE